MARDSSNPNSAIIFNWFDTIKENKKNTKTHDTPTLDNVSKRKRPYCPYCKGHLNFAEGEWNNKRCTTCKRWVKPFYAP
jgi:tRNA(Ile2) C34 agmatinyltransferase TiaS|tara:strand:- start:135 stop:371 length:237 start_codon:yes stop_codon:yes gene_type:complete